MRPVTCLRRIAGCPTSVRAISLRSSTPAGTAPRWPRTTARGPPPRSLPSRYPEHSHERPTAALAAHVRGEAMERVTTADLMDDLRKVVHDTEALLRATEGQIGEKADEARRRVQAALDSARTRLKAMQGSAVEMGEEAVRVTETYVRDNPWQAVGVAAGVGLLLGLLLSRR